MNTFSVDPSTRRQSSSGNVTGQHSLGLVIKTVLRKLRDPTIVLRVRLLQVRAHPGLEIRAGFGPRVPRLCADGVQRCEAHAERHLFNVHLGDEVILVSNLRRKLKQLQQRVACEAPSLGVPCRKGVRVGKGLGERDDGRLAIQGPSQLLRVLENDVEVDRSEETGRKRVRALIDFAE